MGFIETLEERLSKIESSLALLQDTFNNYPFKKEEEDELMDINGVAKLLHRSKDTIYIYTHKKLIPHSKVAGNLLFSKKEILEWVKANKVKTLLETEISADEFLEKNYKKKIA
ncbi:MAG TPA: helix-turn-helix domain-containing protein [Flavisolibacter sp.]|jgi:predicted DNA-binding transcriptional regulator AlpA|nr:helix-turn-helix domain-containing protein [Flavisolibacter sp.]